MQNLCLMLFVKETSHVWGYLHRMCFCIKNCEMWGNGLKNKTQGLETRLLKVELLWTWVAHFKNTVSCVSRHEMWTVKHVHLVHVCLRSTVELKKFCVNYTYHIFLITQLTQSTFTCGILIKLLIGLDFPSMWTMQKPTVACMFTCLMQLSYNQIIRLTELVRHFSQTKVFKWHFIALDKLLL